MSPYTVRWGIIATGGISTKFSKDLLVDPSTRDASDVSHKIAAIGSRSLESAEKFVQKLKNSGKDDPTSWGVANGGLDGVKPYGIYDEVYNDPNVDAVYVGTPQNLHHRNAKDALLAGKHVLCEKPFTLDLEELDELIAIAKEKNLFLMEAVWTRFHPIAYAVQDVLFSGKLGKVKRFAADFSMDVKPDDLPVDHRMIAPELLGGSLLDMGPYPSVWAMLALYQHPDNQKTAPKFLTSAQIKYPKTGVDQSSTWLLQWEKLGVVSSLTTDLATNGFAPSTCTIQCEEGDLAIEWPPFQPTVFNILPHPNLVRGDITGTVKEASRHEFGGKHPGGSMHYEADHVARCIRDGKIESERMPWEESRVVQAWFDKVRRGGDTVHKDLKGGAGQ